MKELLKTILDESFHVIESTRQSVPRDAKFPQAEQMIKVAIGMRRAGKTYTLYQKINSLLDKGVSKEQILFVDFEDERLLPMTVKQMGELLDAHYSLYPKNHTRKCYFFLDEVQNIPNWHQVVRRYHNSNKVHLTITGSSAKLLSTEINTSLRGRSLSVNIMPYSFDEFRIAHKLTAPQPPFGKQAYDVATQHMMEFFTKGGFPAVQHMNTYEWRETLQGYIDSVILRDVIERHNISNVALLKYLTKTLLINAASPFSIHKFFKDIKSQGYKVSRETLYNYIHYLEDAFLIFTVPLYSESIRIQQTIPKKIYAIDNSLITVHSLGIKDIYNKYLENQIYLDLKRQGKDIYFYRTTEGYEIDFITIDKNGDREIIQVAWELSCAKTAKRERRALDSAQKELGIKGRIITHLDYAVGDL